MKTDTPIEYDPHKTQPCTLCSGGKVKTIMAMHGIIFNVYCDSCGACMRGNEGETPQSVLARWNSATTEGRESFMAAGGDFPPPMVWNPSHGGAPKFRPPPIALETCPSCGSQNIHGGKLCFACGFTLP